MSWLLSGDHSFEDGKRIPYMPMHNTGVSARLNNALNASYNSFADYPMPGLSLTLGLNVRYNSPGKRE